MSATQILRSAQTPLNAAMHAIDSLQWSLANARSAEERAEIALEIVAANAHFALICSAL